jgi:ATP-binding cassette subfamily B protein
LNQLFETPSPDQRFLVPEVVQTSAMDCGPAALKSILEGFDIPVSYGRLREACQTDVDGTSINTVEDLAILLGLQAEQVMLPADHLVLPEAQALPAIVVVQRSSGLTHFLVVWNRIGDFLQVMDPATGRRWLTWKSFQNEIYIHTFPVPADAWRDWAGSPGLLEPLRRRLSDLKVDQQGIDDLIASALADQSWRSLATLDAATRMTAAIVSAKGIEAGAAAQAVLQRFYSLNLAGALPKVESSGGIPALAGAPESLLIPSIYWSALPLVETEQQAAGLEPLQQLYLRGAVLVRILGRQKALDEWAEAEPGKPKERAALPGIAAELPPDLQAALKEPVNRPELEVWKALKEDGLLTPAILGLALLLSTFGVTVEALLFQGMIRLAQAFSLLSQRLLAALVIVLFVAMLLVLELPISATILRMGRHLELRLRIAFLEKLPRLGDRYFRSRLASDMTQRAHDLRSLRMLPNLGVQLLRTFFQMVLTAIGVIWLDPISAPLALLGTAFFVSLTILSRPVLEERDLRMRTHLGALSRFYLDALLGLVPIKTHGAERAMMRQHEAQLYEWARTGREYYNVASIVQAFGTMLYTGFAIAILVNYIARGGQPGEILLLFYWTLNLPALGQSLADQIQQYPMQRNRILRLLEPLSAPDEEQSWQSTDGSASDDLIENPQRANAVSVDIQDVRLQAGGHVILDDLNLKIEPGEHIAVVGLSGAGKTSFVGLLLGWHRPSRGRILVDGDELDGAKIQSLRRETAWVDPAVSLWNRSLYENLRYGIEHSESAPIGEIIQKADLFEVMQRLPDGLKTILGESGGLVSGGEGQRVRLGRAMLRPDIRLVIMDEPFRGLDRAKRRSLLMQSRSLWAGVTMLCATHDVGETLTFPRVMVIEDGRLIEDDQPSKLAANPGSRYRQLLDAEESVRKNLWANVNWRRFYMDSGKLTQIDDVNEGGAQS